MEESPSDSVIREQERDGVIKAVSELELSDDGETHFLLHHAVIRIEQKQQSWE